MFKKWASFTLVVFCLVAVALACESDYDPGLVTPAPCAASESALFAHPPEYKVLTPADLSAEELAVHEERMAYILDISKARNRKFVASIYDQEGNLKCIGVNTGSPNLITHGEIAAINNCTSLHGSTSFPNHTIYTTGEPCAMCAAAILWANFKTVVWGTYNRNLYCKVCMSNIPLDAKDVLSRYYGLRSTPTIAIGGVLEAETDEWFVPYCDRNTSIFYIKPECACSPVGTTPLTVSQTQVAQWVDGGNTYTQFNGVITHVGTVTQYNPKFTSSPSGALPSQIWGLTPTSNNDEWVFAWNPIISPGQTFNFGYIVQGTTQITFTFQQENGLL